MLKSVNFFFFRMQFFSLFIYSRPGNICLVGNICSLGNIRLGGNIC